MTHDTCEVCNSIVRGRPQRIALDGFEATVEIECCRECFGATAAFLYVDREHMTAVAEPPSPSVATKEPEDTTFGAENPG